MPVFFFNHFSAGNVCVDDVGTEFPSLEAAYLDTCDAVLDIAFEKLRTRQDPENDSFAIMNVDGQMLMHVPFSEVLRPRQTGKMPAAHRRHQVIAACQQQMVRSHTLKAEIREEFEKTQSAIASIRTSLARMMDVATPQSLR